MPSSVAAGFSVAASRCCKQLGLVRRFSSALSVSSTPVSAAAVRTEPKSVPTTACSGGINNRYPTGIMSIPTIANGMLIDSGKYNLLTTAGVLRRTMATSNRKAIDAKNAKRLKIQQKKKKNTNANKAASGTDDGSQSVDEANNDSNNPFLQHQEWVKFQQSITVDGFQTGQTTTATVLKKSRGGKQARRKREQELAASTDGAADGSISAVAQKFPAIRYSPEETADLLRQAYEALPPRAGKRGNRNLRRQENRWRRVRKNRSDAKAQKINAHYDQMEKRQYKRDRTRDTLEAASAQREIDLAYQGKILQRWMDVTMQSGDGISTKAPEETANTAD